jgi:general secretion pathway protein D
MLAILAACASDNLIKGTRQMMSEGRADEALATLTKAMQDDPGNGPIRQEFFRQRDYAISQWLVRAESLRAPGQFDAADELYKRVLKYDPGNARATQGLAQTETDRRHRVLIAEADRAMKAEALPRRRDTL